MAYDKIQYSRYKCVIKKETEKAVLLEFEGMQGGKIKTYEKWIPLSVTKIDSDIKTIYIADWFVEKNNLQISKFKY